MGNCYGFSLEQFVINVIIIIGIVIACAFLSVHIATRLGFPYFLSFIPLLFGIAIGIVIAEAARWLFYAVAGSLKHRS